ncbi:linear amide C-N hydrolase [Corallococcus sp. ZKHCc1 1396]|uniref:Linear amide C-N hydrolase n=1 Tax=Corallococcus soli TaxID=2710757 RepID=A0ABR9PSY2_9BACT|nr:linear amide C-N hydrolase [Corallococcus soli]MBE4750907.1 linear amide C-N hydrolase [Corallococcus soli]
MCTNLMISVPANPGLSSPDTSRMFVSARALEMPGEIAQSVYVMPSKQSWPLTPATPGSAAQGWTTLRWTNPYGFVGIAPSGSGWQSLPTFNDGINSQGLSVGALWLAPGTQYGPLGTGAGTPKNQVSFLDFPAWILGNFASVSDFLSALPNIIVVGPAPGAQFYVPLHYIVTDNTGQSAVIEFINGTPQIYKCTNGVMTNWPTYDWQLTNVQNYYNLTLVGTATSTSGAGNPVGGGLVGLPGDSLSASRFVRATILSQGISQLPADGTGWLPAPGVFPTTPPSKNPPGFAGPEQTAVMVALQLTQICMGTPYGMLLETVKNSPSTTGTPDTMPSSSTTTYGDYTMWTSVRDHTNLKYYFMSAFSGILTMIDLNSLDFATTPAYPAAASIAVMPQGGAPWRVDATKMLTPAAA